MSTNWYNDVREFTEKSMETSLQGKPVAMTPEQVQFAMEMMTSEIVELGQTVFTTEKAQEIIRNAVNKDLSNIDIENETQKITEQCDAIIDVIYYALNCAAKQKFPLNEIFAEVHRANMSKAINGKFQKREDGKIIKPEGWQPPNLEKIIIEY